LLNEATAAYSQRCLQFWLPTCLRIIFSSAARNNQAEQQLLASDSRDNCRGHALCQHCPRSMRNRVCVMVRCPSLCLSVPLSVTAWAHSSKPTAPGLLLWARRYRSSRPTGRPALSGSDVRRANAGSATLSANVGS